MTDLKDIIKPLEAKEKTLGLNETMGLAILKLIEMLEQTQDFKESELNAQSIFVECEPLESILGFRNKNKKYLKHKHPNEILQAIREIARTIQFNSYNQDVENLNSFEKLRHKLSRK